MEGAAVTASVIGDGKEKKVVVYKYKPKKGFPQKKRPQTAFHKAADQIPVIFSYD